jgi:hypothetical protein
LVAALPLGVMALADEAGAQPGGAAVEGKSAAAEPKGDEERSRAGKDQPAEGLNLEKRLERLRSERSGSLEPVRLVDPGATRIAPATGLTRQELGLPAPVPALDRIQSLPQLSDAEKERWFQTREWRERFTELRRCPGEVALRRSARIRSVPAGVVLLRWTTDHLGRARDTAVVAESGRIDPDVMTCVHRKMGEWQVLPPPATPYRADWTLNLRSGR